MLDIDRAKVEVPYQTRFWGQQCTCEPTFVEEVLGDGDVLLGIQPLATRPNYYVIRVDSKWHLYGCRECKDDCPDLLVEHLDEIYDAIEDEYGEAEQIRYYNENDLDQGEEPDSDDWPVFDLSCGTSWFTLDPKDFLTAAACAGICEDNAKVWDLCAGNREAIGHRSDASRGNASDIRRTFGLEEKRS